VNWFNFRTDNTPLLRKSLHNDLDVGQVLELLRAMIRNVDVYLVGFGGVFVASRFSGNEIRRDKTRE